MTTQYIEEIIPVKEQRFVLPGRQSWIDLQHKL
jgi:hypothetical protein